MPRRRNPRPFSVGSSHWRADGQAKVGFATQHEALSAADEQSRDAGVELGVYRCGFCHRWHMGRSVREDY